MMAGSSGLNFWLPTVAERAFIFSSVAVLLSFLSMVVVHFSGYQYLIFDLLHDVPSVLNNGVADQPIPAGTVRSSTVSAAKLPRKTPRTTVSAADVHHDHLQWQNSSKAEISHKPIAAVCIVGQINRLEIESKLRHLVQENDHKFHLWIFAVLNTGRPAFAQDLPAAHLNYGISAKPCYSESTSEEDLRDNLLRDFGESRTILRVADPYDIGDADQLVAKNPWVTEVFQSSHTGEHQRVEHFKMNLRQWHNDKTCSDMVREQEHATGQKIDIVIRIRDNGLVLKPMSLINFWQPMQEWDNEQRVFAKNCDSWGGVNDKVWIIPRSKMEDALSRTHPDIINGEGYLAAKPPYNSERAVKYTWDHYGVLVEEVSANLLPVVDGRCVSTGDRDNAPTVRPLPAWADCRPDGSVV